MKTIKATMFTDPSHGWLAVPVQVLRDYYLVEHISKYSYYSSGTDQVFLEEDRDAYLLQRAVNNAGDKLDVVKVNNLYSTENFIRRNLARYTPELIKQ